MNKIFNQKNLNQALRGVEIGGIVVLALAIPNYLDLKDELATAKDIAQSQDYRQCLAQKINERAVSQILNGKPICTRIELFGGLSHVASIEKF